MSGKNGLVRALFWKAKARGAVLARGNVGYRRAGVVASVKASQARHVGSWANTCTQRRFPLPHATVHGLGSAHAWDHPPLRASSLRHRFLSVDTNAARIFTSAYNKRADSVGVKQRSLLRETRCPVCSSRVGPPLYGVGFAFRSTSSPQHQRCCAVSRLGGGYFSHFCCGFFFC